jgi:xylan 1,4-beta-xylosidase
MELELMLKNIARFCLLFAAATTLAQTPVNVNVDLSQKVGAYSSIYSWFGYDESNYSTTKNGQALLRQLHDLSPVPVYVRAHFLLATGDGKPDLKWSSSNVYTEDANGKPVYSWTILDQIFDAYAAAHVRPMVELGFMPEALSTHPEPYHIGGGSGLHKKNLTSLSEVDRSPVARQQLNAESSSSFWIWPVSAD